MAKQEKEAKDKAPKTTETPNTPNTPNKENKASEGAENNTNNPLDVPNDPNANKVIPGTEFTEEKKEALENDKVETDLVAVNENEFTLKGVRLTKPEIDNLIELGLLKDGNLTVEDKEAFKADEYIFVTEKDLEEIASLKEAGVKVGVTRLVAMDQVKAFKESTKDGAAQAPKTTEKDKAKPKAKDKDKLIYHGDYLAENQLGGAVEVSFDWNEVNAPEHEKYRPTV